MLEEKLYNYCKFIQKKNHYNETIPNIMNVLPEIQPKDDHVLTNQGIYINFKLKI